MSGTFLNTVHVSPTNTPSDCTELALASAQVMETEVERSRPYLMQPLTVSCIIPNSLATVQLLYGLRSTSKMAPTLGPMLFPDILSNSSYLRSQLKAYLFTEVHPSPQAPYPDREHHTARLLPHGLLARVRPPAGVV